MGVDIGSNFNFKMKQNIEIELDSHQTQLNSQNTRINNIVAEAGNSNPEIVDARGGYSVLNERLNALKNRVVLNVTAMKATNLQANDYIKTLGYYSSGDGGGAEYLVQATGTVDDGSVILLNNGLYATLIHNGFVNYKMFGAVGDGTNDDGVQIKKAHTYANTKRIPVINLYGEYWIKATRDFLAKTSTHLGSTKFHVNEALAPETGAQPYHITTDFTSFYLDSSFHTSILPKMKKGTKLISELAPYEDHYIRVFDNTTKVGKRQGPNPDAGNDMEEFFVVGKGGVIIGDITWDFTNITSIEARKIDDEYLTFEGGVFLLSGDLTGATNEVYKKTGIWIHRSRVIVRNQFVGLDEGVTENLTAASDGFYHISGCYDILVQNARLIPRKYYEINGTPRGTYGISGSRALYVTLENVVGEGTFDDWGVMGLDMMKNLYIRNCKLSRIDVHFHGWNFYVRDTEVGNRGFRLSGGGDLVVENVSVHGKIFIQFREDYGSIWDGDISIKGQCSLIVNDPTYDAKILTFDPIGAYDYGYKIIHGRRIIVEDFVFDYREQPTNNASAYLALFTHFATLSNDRVQYPYLMSFKNVYIKGRTKGLRFFQELRKLNVYYVPTEGLINGEEVITNAYYRLENIQTEDIVDVPQGTTNTHMFLDVLASDVYTDNKSLIPKIEIINCKHLNLQTKSSAGKFIIKDSELSVLDANGGGSSKGIYEFVSTEVKSDTDVTTDDCIYLGGARHSWVNCTIHPVKVNGVIDWARSAANTGIFKIWAGNFQINGSHVGTKLTTPFVDNLKASYPSGAINTYLQRLLAHNQNAYYGSDRVPAASGTTAERPTTGIYVGFPYFDTDLNKLVLWSGSAWVESLGTKRGTFTGSGDGVATSFSFAHGLGRTGVPTILPANATTGTAEVSHATVTSTNITVVFKTAPPTGTNNVSVHWSIQG